MLNFTKVENSKLEKSLVGGILVTVGSYNTTSENNGIIQELENLQKGIEDIVSELKEIQGMLEAGEKTTKISDRARYFLKEYASDMLKKLLGI